MADEQESLSGFSEKVKNQLASYIQVKMDLMKAEGTEKISMVFSKMITGLIVLLLLLFVVLFGSLVAGFYLGGVFGSLIKGFGIVALFYGVLLVIVLAFRKQLIQNPVTNALIAIIYNNHE